MNTENIHKAVIMLSSMPNPSRDEIRFVAGLYRLSVFAVRKLAAEMAEAMNVAVYDIVDDKIAEFAL